MAGSIPTPTPSGDTLTAVNEGAARGLQATGWGILISICLAAVKLLAGWFGNSYALIADGVESLLDVVSALVVWTSLRVAARPPSREYPYGFGRAESLAALVVAVFILLAAVGIAIQSVREILTPHHAPAPFTLLVLVLVIAFKEFMYRRLHQTGQEIGSQALMADAWHHRSDALTSLAAFVGISIALLAGPGYESADDWGALAACAIIGINGLILLRTALAEILDVRPPLDLEQKVRLLAESVPDVRKIEKCRLRRSGLVLFVDIHVVVDGRLSVAQGHEIGHRVKDLLLASSLPILDVSIHIEPWEENAGSLLKK